MINSLHFIKYLARLAPALTQTSKAERISLQRHSQGKKRLVEIGVFHGVNTRAFRKRMHSDGILIAVDPFPRCFFGIRGYGWARRIAHREVNKEKRGRVLWIERKGEEAPFLDEVLPWLPVDFIFIDGNHSYDGLEGDWLAWKDNLAPNGIVALHDSRQSNGCGAEQFVRDVVLKDSGFVLVEEVDTLTVLRKRP